MEASNTSQTIISSDVEIIGTIKTSGSIQINGKLEGDLQCEGDATIGKDAQIKGNLSVSSVVMAGSITGNITAKDRIQMQASARVMGDIKAKRLSVEDGVTFIGHSEVNPSSGGGSSAASSAAPKKEEGEAEGKSGGLFGKK